LVGSLFFTRSAAHRPLHSFPTRRSSDLAVAAGKREVEQLAGDIVDRELRRGPAVRIRLVRHRNDGVVSEAEWPFGHEKALDRVADRKSTRLNSSHVSISYAVFCLKKKKI